MSNVYNHRPMVAAAPISSRVMELLEALRSECEKLSQDASTMKVHHDEYEQRLNNQVNEMQAFQQSLYDLERNHQKIKNQYEDEILRLRRELESRGGPPAPPGPFHPVNNTSAGQPNGPPPHPSQAGGPQGYGPPPHMPPSHLQGGPPPPQGLPSHSSAAAAAGGPPAPNGTVHGPPQGMPHPDHPGYAGAPPQSGPPSSMYPPHSGMPAPRHITTPQISSQPLGAKGGAESRHGNPPPPHQQHPMGSQPPPAHSMPPEGHLPAPTDPAASHAMQKL